MCRIWMIVYNKDYYLNKNEAHSHFFRGGSSRAKKAQGCLKGNLGPNWEHWALWKTLVSSQGPLATLYLCTPWAIDSCLKHCMLFPRTCCSPRTRPFKDFYSAKAERKYRRSSGNSGLWRLFKTRSNSGNTYEAGNARWQHLDCRGFIPRISIPLGTSSSRAYIRSLDVDGSFRKTELN